MLMISRTFVDAHIPGLVYDAQHRFTSSGVLAVAANAPIIQEKLALDLVETSAHVAAAVRPV